MQRVHLSFLMLGLLLVTQSPTAFAADNEELLNGMWHVRVSELWGQRSGRRAGEGRNMDIYAVFRNGKWANAIATARGFNTSIHLPKEVDVTLDLQKRTLKGRLVMIMTPDPWIPQDGQDFELEVILDGHLKPDKKRPYVLEGTYVARRPDGKPIYDNHTEVRAHLAGGSDKLQTDWGNSVWNMPMTPIVPRGSIDQDLLRVSIGVANGGVQWGSIGLTANPKFPVAKTYYFDVDRFDKSDQLGIARGSFVVNGRMLHPAGDPDQRYEAELVARRVNGLAGGQLTLWRLRNGRRVGPPTKAYGRGICHRGGGDSGKSKALWRHELNPDPWWVPVEGHKPVQPGEHPRLLFRKSDLPALRRRARTEEGRRIIARLRTLLGHNGEAVPTRFNTTPPHNHNKSPELPVGTFTTWHAAGFGFLYQITGEEKYADLSRQCVQLMLDGKIDIDNRYSWFKPGTEMRCTSVLNAMAYAYDFCYDAWPETFRRKIALEIQDFDKVTASAEAGAKRKGREPKPTGIEDLVGRTGYPPGSNHYGSLIGCGLALLAIQGDPGVNTGWVKDRLAEVELNIPRMLEYGFGDAGWFAEGVPPSRLSSNGGLVEMLHAFRTVAGKDYITGPRPNAQYITLRWIYHLGGHGFAAYPNRGTYGGDHMYGRGSMLSHTGDFAFGFGAIDPKYRRALLWTYNKYVRAGERRTRFAAGDTDLFNAFQYPHRAVYAFVNWPIGKTPQNPAEVLPLTMVDRIHGYFLGRERWQDGDDIIVTQLHEYGPGGYYSAKDGKHSYDRPGVLRIWGRGLKGQMSTDFARASVMHYEAAEDGSFNLASGDSGLVVDFSKASGAPLTIVAWGSRSAPGKRRDKEGSNGKASLRFHHLQVAGDKVSVGVLQDGGGQPAIRVDGNTLHVGGQTYRWDGQKIVPGTFNR